MPVDLQNFAKTLRANPKAFDHACPKRILGKIVRNQEFAKLPSNTAYGGLSPYLVDNHACASRDAGAIKSLNYGQNMY